MGATTSALLVSGERDVKRINQRTSCLIPNVNDTMHVKAK